jgi:glucose/mannose-6-phosphate isomerase
VTDTLGFLDAVCGLPEQLASAHELAGAIDPSAFPRASDVDHVVVMGMGGSGVAGDVLAAVATDAPVPVIVLKRYRAPAFIGPRTLAIALSYSGDTEETLTMASDAAERGARLVAISVGGALRDLAAERSGLHIGCPPGLLPRAALGALVAPLFVALFRTGLLPEAHALLVGAQEQLARRRDKCHPRVEGDANPARRLARRIDRTLPLVYGGGALGAVAAYRWKCDVNENAKAPAFWHAYPELDHNEICGWGQHGDVTRQLVTLVELRHGFEHPQLSRRFELTREIIEETLHQVLTVDAEGNGRLAQVLDLMYVGDFTSVYLALDNDVDPGPIDAIAQLKARLAE